MIKNFKIYKDCGIYRVVCTDYDRDEYLPSVFINESGADILKRACQGEEITDKDALNFIHALEDRGFYMKKDEQ